MTCPVRFTLPLLVAFVAGCGEPAMERFTAPTEGFTVLMPGKPTKQSKSLPMPDGSTLAFNIYGVDLGPRAYMVSGTTIGPATSAIPADRVLDGRRDGAVRNVSGGALISEKRLTLQGYPGREINFTFTPPGGNSQGIGRSRIFLVDGKLYQAVVVDTRGQGIDKTGERFLKSFTLTRGKRKRSD